MRRSLWIAVVFACVATAASAEVHRFDFGEGDLRPGWTKVSPTDERLDGNQIIGSHVEVPDYVALMRQKKARKVYPSDLSCDFVGGQESATFTIELPSGFYRCWMLFGHATDKYSIDIPWYFDTTVAINGIVYDKIRLRARAVFQDRAFVCEAPAGKLRFAFSTDRVQWMIAAMIIYTDEEAADVASEINAIKEEIDFLPVPLAGRWRRRGRMIHEKSPILTTEEIDRGYVVFHRSSLCEVYPDSKPTRDEIDATAAAFATPGEFEPVTFSIYPLDDMHVTSVTAELPDATVQMARVVCERVREGGYNSAVSGKYRVEPSHLIPVDYRDVTLAKESPIRFWITAQVDEDASPGVKKGSAQITFDDDTTCEIPLTLEVMPFTLQKDPGITYSAYYDTRAWFFHGGNWRGHPRRDVLTKITMDETRAYLSDLRNHGMNALAAPIAWAVKDGKPVAAAVERSNALYELYREYGLATRSVWYRIDMAEVARAAGVDLRDDPNPKRIPEGIDDPQYVDFFRELVRAMEDERRKNNWPEIIYAPVDEPGSRDQQDFTKVLCGIIKEEGARTYCTMKWWLTKTFSDVVDIRCYGTSFYPGNENNETNWPEAGRQENTREEQEFWVYPNVLTCGSGVSAAFGRFWYGFYGFKIGLQGYNPWHHANWPGNPFNDFDHFYNGGRFVLPGPEGPIPTLAYEGAREGIDDMRYIYTLKQAIESADDVEETVAAKALLDEIERSVPPYRQWILSYAHRGIPTSKMLDDPKMRKMWSPLRPPAWPPQMMHDYRRRIADAVIELTPDPANEE